MLTATRQLPTRWGCAGHVYVSEGRDCAFIAHLARSGAAYGAVVANEFTDPVYNRSGITLASSDAKKLEAALTAVCKEALLSLDLRKHTASHPRLGIVDHIACNPLGSATCEEAAAIAVAVAQRLGQGDASASPPVPSVPVYLYGFAREDRRSLADLRRSLGYFGGSAKGEWSGLAPHIRMAIASLTPDFGMADEVNDRIGIVVLGATPWVHNYNILLTDANTTQADLLARCRVVARATSTRGGGLPAVETMALPHEHGVEVACNLLDVSVTGPSDVLQKVRELCQADGLHLASDYFTNKIPEDILKMVSQ